MAAAPGFLTAEQFEQRYGEEKPYHEYWFGKAIQKPMGTETHSILQGLIFMFLRQRGWRVGTELRLKISKAAFPVPDVVAHNSRMEGPYPTKPVDLCVEILSPGDRLQQLFGKAAHYLDWGIGSVWIIDGETRRAFVMSLDDPRPIEIGLTGYLMAGAGEKTVAISMRELFDELDKDLA